MKGLQLKDSANLSALEDEYETQSQGNIDKGHFFRVEERSIGKSFYDDAAYSHRANGRSGTWPRNASVTIRNRVAVFPFSSR